MSANPKAAVTPIVTRLLLIDLPLPLAVGEEGTELGSLRCGCLGLMGTGREAEKL